MENASNLGARCLWPICAKKGLGSSPGKFLGVFHFLWNSGFARMPTGFETYTFCLMIASRGAVYHTRKSAGEWKHFHRGCDCKVAPRCIGSIDKTIAFEFALGFAPSDALEVIRQLYGLIADNPPTYKDKGPC